MPYINIKFNLIEENLVNKYDWNSFYIVIGYLYL